MSEDHLLGEVNMAVNKNAKRLTALSVAALKAAGGDVRAWFAVGVGKDFLFYIDKKVAQPTKFKEPLTLKNMLTKLKVDVASTIQKDSLVIAGTIQSAEGQAACEMTVKVKANGGGKSTLKSLVKDAGFKKIVGNVEIVTAHRGEVDTADAEMDSTIRTEMKDKKVKGVKVTPGEHEGEEKIEVPDNLRKALKVYKWWDKDGRADMERILDAVQGVAPETPIDDATKSEAEDTLQTIHRRLKKFAKAGMYDLFADGKFWPGKLAKLRPQDYDLTKPVLKNLLKQTDSLLKSLQGAKNASDFTDQSTELLASIEDDAQEYSELETIGRRLQLDDGDFLEFMEAGKGQLPLVKDLVSKFSNADVKMLLKHVGGGNWDHLFLQIMMM